MIRRDKEIKERSKIEEIIKDSLTCRIGLVKDNHPYVVPVSFGYDGDFIYLHTASQGKKIDYMESNNSVCVEFDEDVKIVRDDTVPCKWTVSYKSVICYGKVEEILSEKEKIYALNRIMLQYSGKVWPEEDFNLHNVRLWKIKISEISGKETKDKS